MPSNLVALFINLDRSTARRAQMERRLHLLGLQWSRFAAIDGAALLPALSEADRRRFARCHGRLPRAGEIGCYRSHLGALGQFLSAGAEFGLILEDDAAIDEDAAGVIRALVAEDAPRDWDFVKLQSRRETRAFPGRGIDGRHRLTVPYTRSTGATAYLVNRRAARAMLDRLQVIEAPWDHAFDRPHHLRLRARLVQPCPVGLHPENSGASTIETAQPEKLRGFAKLPALWWRTRSEMGRFFWAIGAALPRPGGARPSR